MARQTWLRMRMRGDDRYWFDTSQADSRYFLNLQNDIARMLKPILDAVMAYQK